MKNYIELHINRDTHCISGNDIFLPLSDYLRTKLHKVGAKEVCMEGDCGACTVLLGKYEDGKVNYKAINSCICYVYQLDKCHIVTIEGINDKDQKLNPVQESIVKKHGTQCGYCTPGIVVSLCSYLTFSPRLKTLTKSDVQNALVGNLCRCTGYENIIEAALSTNIQKINEIYSSPKLTSALSNPTKEGIEVRTNGHIFYQGATLQETLRLKSENPDAKILAGGTDLHVLCNKKDLDLKKIIHISNLKELRNIEAKDNYLTVGAGVTLQEFELYALEFYPPLKEFLKLFASPQIKNIATLIGNIANASPVGDTIPFLLVMDAELILESIKGKRKININNFYKGYKLLALDPTEIIIHANIPLLKKDEILRLYKVSKRKYLDISSFSAAIKMKENEGLIQHIKIAFGGVGPTVQRVQEIEKFLSGKEIRKDTFEEALKLMDDAIKPISDVRGQKEYRLQLAKNILKKFYFELTERKVFV